MMAGRATFPEMIRWIMLFAFPYTIVSSGQETLIGLAGKDFVILGADSSVSQSSIALTASNLDKIAILPNRLAAAVVGDVSDTDRMVGTLSTQCALREWERSVGSDVNHLDIWGADVVSTGGGVVVDRTAEEGEGTQNDENSQQGPILRTTRHRCLGLSVDELAHLASYEIAKNLRTRNRMNVQILVAGVMKEGEEGNDRDDHNDKPDAAVDAGIPRAGTRVSPRLFWIDPYGSMRKVRFGAHGYGSNFCLSILDEGYRPDMTKDEAIALVQSCFEQLRVRYVINSPQPPCIKCLDASKIKLGDEPLGVDHETHEEDWTLIR